MPETATTNNDLAARVRRGAALLDRKIPGWAKKIDAHRIEIHCCYNCILGQLYGHYDDGFHALGLWSGCENGFNGLLGERRALADLWRREIAARREPHP